MRLKRWESPRRQGRNDKGKGGSARQRQVKKQHKLWSQRLKQNQNEKEGDRPPFLMLSFEKIIKNFIRFIPIILRQGWMGGKRREHWGGRSDGVGEGLHRTA